MDIRCRALVFHLLADGIAEVPDAKERFVERIVGRITACNRLVNRER
jgi:hypothetical protein